MTPDEVGQLPDRAPLLWQAQVVYKDSAVSYALGTVRVELPDGDTKRVKCNELSEANVGT